jgi:putative aldouronate transport system permease protein
MLDMNTGINDEGTSSPETLKAAAVYVATIPVLAVYPFVQKHFVKGIMIGSLKG